MKFVKNITIVACAASFMFAGNVGFHMANNYGNLDAGASVSTSYGATYDLNGTTSIGWDGDMGMLMMFEVPFGVTLRLAWSAGDDGDDGDFNDDATDVPPTYALGLGYTWWSGGTGFKTSISTNYDYISAPLAGDTNLADENSNNLSVVVGFGF